jgi:hypothetical protein
MTDTLPTAPAEPPIAYRAKQARANLGIGRTKFHEEIKAGRLIARKLGTATIILHDDLVAYLRSLPVVQP